MRKKIVIAGLCALALLVGAAALPAQIMGLYYQEVEKDGRVYVFNTPERYKGFMASGEIGTSVTLIGKAEGGKTLVAENETAADLYLFKHNLPGYERDTPPPPKPPFNVSWKDGKTSISSKSASLGISNRVQVRFTSEDLDANSATSKPERDSFRLRRMKTKFDGWVYDKNLTYEMQVNFADSSNVLEDANVNWDFTGGKKAVMIKAGQFKVPFGRQELTSSGSQQFVDRSTVSNTFARGRDIGVQLWGTPNGGTIDWRVGLFNGNGRTTSRNDNDELQLNARLQWAPFGDPKYSESDFEGADKFLFAIAANLEENTREIAATATAVAHQNEQSIVGIDAVAKYKGFSLFVERFDRENDRTMGFSDFDDEGTVIQAGYFVIPKKFEIALRLAEFDPNSDGADNERTEEGVAFNYFWNKHNHKLQADYRQLEDKARNAKDKEIRLQYQLIF
jgi:phosphate-selective porin OprO and OprP